MKGQYYYTNIHPLCFQLNVLVETQVRLSPVLVLIKENYILTCGYGIDFHISLHKTGEARSILLP